MMKEYLVDAIVLKSIRARDADRVITIYTKQAGKKRVMAHGADKPTSKKRGAVQPFSYSKLMLRRGKDIDSVSQGESIEIFPEFRQSLEGLAAANYLAELVDAFTPEEDPDTAVYNLLLGTLRVMKKNDYQILIWAFELRLLALAGYRPDLDECICCSKTVQGEKVCFLPEHGGVSCWHCKEPELNSLSMSCGALESMKALIRWDIARLHQLKVSSEIGKEIGQVIRCFTEYHLDKRIKSLKFIDLLEGMNNLYPTRVK